MARLQLQTRLAKTIEFNRPYDRSGVAALIPIYRLRIQLAVVPPNLEWPHRPRIGIPEARSLYAVVDTGSPISVFHYDAWKPFEKEIRWLTPIRTNVNARQTLTILGGTWPYRLGRIRIAAFDDTGGWLPPYWTLGMFLEDSPGCPSVNILGLRSRFLERRQLRHAGDDSLQLPIWFLEDA